MDVSSIFFSPNEILIRASKGRDVLRNILGQSGTGRSKTEKDVLKQKKDVLKQEKTF